MNFKSLEDKCLYYRGVTDYKLMPNSNIIVMLDGKNFSKLIKNKFKKPFDDAFINMMNKTAEFLCKNVQGCKFAYTQSDEISILITDYDSPETDTLFSGRLCKIQSILAALATSEFNKQFIKYHLFDKKESWSGVNFADLADELDMLQLAQFDCKAWIVPNQNDAFAWFLYRQIDCIRNSKQQTAQTYLTHKDLMKKDADEQVRMVKELKEIDWNEFKDQYKYGRFVYKEEQQLSMQKPSGEIVDYSRCKFRVHPAFPLMNDNGKEKFFKIANMPEQK